MSVPSYRQDDPVAQAAEEAFQALGDEELLALASSAPVGLFAAVDPFGTVLANRRFLEIVGRRRREVLGDVWLDAVHPDDRAAVDAAGITLRETGELEMEHRFVRPDGEVRWVRVWAVKVRNDPVHPTFVGSLVDVTEIKQIEAALHENEVRFRALVEHSFDIISVIEVDGTVRYTSPSAARITGLPSYTAGNTMFERIHPDDADEVVTKLAATAEKPGLGPVTDVRIQHADGHWITLEAVANNLLEDPDINALVVFARDVTSQRATEEALRASEARQRDQASILEMIATSTPLAETLAEICRHVEGQLEDARCTVLLVADDGLTLRHGAAPSMPGEFNAAVDGIAVADGATVCGSAAFRGTTVAVADAASSMAPPFDQLARMYGVGGVWSTPIRASSDGRVLGTFATYLSESRLPGADEEAIVEAVVQVAAVAIERHEFENRLSKQAMHDPLTELPNRALFAVLLDSALLRAQRSGKALAVLFLDLDGFKIVNDSLGHSSGDEVLVALSRRLGRVLRHHDDVDEHGERSKDVLARFGGDEFTVLCEFLDQDDAPHQAVQVAERLIEAVREPVTVAGDEQFISASVGIALAFRGDENPESLLRDSDAAMYQAKEKGRGRYEVFDTEMRSRARSRHEIENALHRAVAGGEFRVFYQPIVDLPTGRCVGVEALLRWQHPDRGLLEPRDFLEAAEETGLIVPVGAWLLDEAAKQAVAWREYGSLQDLRCSINLSGRQLVHAELADVVAGVLARTGLPADALCVEITETLLMRDVDIGISAVKALKALGVCVSIDDFGTGYSALGSLRQFPIDDVKIDRTFVERLGTEPEDSAIVSAVVSLGHALGVSLTAEGVETEAQLEELRALGVDAAQGFLFAVPQAAEGLAERIRARERWC